MVQYWIGFVLLTKIIILSILLIEATLESYQVNMYFSTIMRKICLNYTFEYFLMFMLQFWVSCGHIILALCGTLANINMHKYAEETYASSGKTNVFLKYSTLLKISRDWAWFTFSSCLQIFTKLLVFIQIWFIIF